MAVVVSTTGIAFAIGGVFLAMRDVMEVGGACASGGAYQVATPCPDGTGLLMGLGIPLGIVWVMVNIAACFRVDAPLAAWFGWPALFLSLGWNFWEYGLDPPVGGPVWGWIVCGVVFVAMGAGPLVLVARHVGLRSLHWTPRSAWWTVHAVCGLAGAALSVAVHRAVS